MGQAAALTVDVLDFKWAMSRVPGAVVVATTIGKGGVLHGMTASSFTSVSLHPPLVSICIAQSATCHEDFCAADRFAICLLSSNQSELATRFATRGADKFSGPGVTFGPHGLPLISDAVVSLVCQRHSALAAGDHTLLVGEVLSASTDEKRAALVYCSRQYGVVVANAPLECSRR